MPCVMLAIPQYVHSWNIYLVVVFISAYNCTEIWWEVLSYTAGGRGGKIILRADRSNEGIHAVQMM